MRLGRVKRGLVPHDQWNVLEVSDVGNRLLPFHAGGLDLPHSKNCHTIRGEVNTEIDTERRSGSVVVKLFVEYIYFVPRVFSILFCSDVHACPIRCYITSFEQPRKFGMNPEGVRERRNIFDSEIDIFTEHLKLRTLCSLAVQLPNLSGMRTGAIKDHT
jgi:hypothetical protein